MKLPKFLYLVTIYLCGLGSASMADTFTWDADMINTGAQDGDGTWTAIGTNFWGTTLNANGTPVSNSTVTDNLVFGVSGTGTVTIDNGGQMLSYVYRAMNGSTLVNNLSTLTFNQSYTIQGLTAGDGLSVGNININNGITVNISSRLDIGAYNLGSSGSSIGAQMWSINNASTLNLSGGGRLQNMQNASATTSTVNITSGTWSMGGYGAGGNDGSGANVGGGGSDARVLVINQGAGAYVTSGTNGGGNLNIGGNASSNASALSIYNLNGGVLSFTNGGALSMGAGNSGAGSTATGVVNVNSGTLLMGGNEIRVGNDGGSGVFNMNGGSLVSTGRMILARRPNAGGAVSGTAIFNGGTSVLSAISFGDNSQAYSAGSKAEFYLTGGVLYMQSNGANAAFVTGTGGNIGNLSTKIVLSGGTLGAQGAWSSTMTMNLSNANGGVTFMATGTDNVSRNITLNGKLTGSGGFTKTGGGTLLLTALNDYTGNTLVSAGALTVDTTSSLAFVLGLNGVNNTLTNSGGTINLNGSITINTSNAAATGNWQIINGVVSYGAGFSVTGWTQLDSNTWQLGSYTFNKTLGLVTAIPEPSTWALMAIGFGILAVSVIRRRRTRKI